jgi:hypothetical protein
MRPPEKETFVFDGTTFEVEVHGDATCDCLEERRCVTVRSGDTVCFVAVCAPTNVPNFWVLQTDDIPRAPFDMSSTGLLRRTLEALSAARQRMAPGIRFTARGGSA